MRPQLFSILDISVPAYFALLLVGFGFATAIAVMWARRIGEDPDVIVDLALASLLMGVVGARVFHVLFDGHFWEYVHLCTDPSLVDWKITEAECHAPRWGGVWDAAKGVCHPRESDCFRWAQFWYGGLTYYGGLLFASAAAVWLLRRDRFPFWKAADLSSVGIATGLGFGRMGCLLAGCCFGRPHGGPLSLSFPPGSAASEAQFEAGLLDSARSWSLAVYPTQVYESAACLAIAAFCVLVVQSRKRYDGQVFLVFLSLYAACRFLLEMLRADDRGGWLGLSTSQLVGIVVVLAVIAAHRYRTRLAAAR